MELKEVFIGTAVVLVGVLAVFGWMNGLNTAYGTTAGNTFSNTLESVNDTLGTNLQSIGVTLANNTQLPEGAGETDQQQGLIRRSLSTLSRIGDFLGIVPSLLEDASAILGIPEQYVDIAKWVFLAAFGITLAYLLLLGIKNWL